MSNLERDPTEIPCGGVIATAPPAHELLPGRNVPLGRYTLVRRFLPHRDRRMVGAWCFLDHYGPDDVTDQPGMRVPPHPHTGLQTVSWLLEGEILHRDSLGSRQVVRPGQLNLMTSGYGIAHSEESPLTRPPVLHGLQLWIALPLTSRNGQPRFEHYPTLPALHDSGVAATVLVGEMAGARSPARVDTPLVGADVMLAAEADTRLPLESDFEYAVLVLTGTVDIEGVALPCETMVYLGCGRFGLSLRAREASRVLLLGGQPFEEQLVMWWNFVGRSHEEIVKAREDWMSGVRFGAVHGYQCMLADRVWLVAGHRIEERNAAAFRTCSRLCSALRPGCGSTWRYRCRGRDRMRKGTSVRMAICSEKGGVGKTTVAANVAALLGERGRTLAVDVDPQGSLGEAFGVAAKKEDDSLAGLLSAAGAVDARALIRADAAPGVDLIPAHRGSLVRVNRELARSSDGHATLRRALTSVTREYRHVVFDTHGDTSDVTLNAICAADVVLGVMSARTWAAKGVAVVAAFVERQRRKQLTPARFLGVVCALYDRTGAEDRDVMAALQHAGLHVFDPYIPVSKRVASSALRQRPVVLAAPASPGAIAYRLLTENLITAMAEA